MATSAALLVAAITAYGLNQASPAGRLPLWRRRKAPPRLSVAHLLTHLRTEIEEYAARQGGKRRMIKEDQFLADAMRGASARNSRSPPERFWTTPGHNVKCKTRVFSESRSPDSDTLKGPNLTAITS